MDLSASKKKLACSIAIGFVVGLFFLLNSYCLDCDSKTSLLFFIEYAVGGFICAFFLVYMLWSFLQTRGTEKKPLWYYLGGSIAIIFASLVIFLIIGLIGKIMG